MRKLVIILIIFLAGCMPVRQEVQSPIQGSAYNSVYNKMYERPTSIEYEEVAGQVRLNIEVDEYGDDYNRIWFDKNHVSEYLSVLEKFEKWHALAIKDQDVLNKELAIVKTAGGLNIKFIFSSGSSTKHYLVMQGGGLGQYSGGIAISYENIPHLQKLLQQFESGTLNITDDSKYN